MEARTAGEMALRAAAHHRRTAHALESRLSESDRAALSTLSPAIYRLVLERGAGHALYKYGNAVAFRCDVTDGILMGAPVDEPTKFLR